MAIIGEVPESAGHWSHLLSGLVSIDVIWRHPQYRPLEPKLPNAFREHVQTSFKLRYNFHFEGAIFGDDIGQIADELIVGVDLVLGQQAVLEV